MSETAYSPMLSSMCRRLNLSYRRDESQGDLFFQSSKGQWTNDGGMGRMGMGRNGDAGHLQVGVFCYSVLLVLRSQAIFLSPLSYFSLSLGCNFYTSMS